MASPSLVAPRAGAWIETEGGPAIVGECGVAPRAGAWIETTAGSPTLRALGVVAPRAGAWIETCTFQSAHQALCRTPCGCVD